MRILFVVPALVSYVSFLRELEESLVAKGNEIHLACSPEDGFGAGDRKIRATRHSIRFPRGLDPLAHWRASRELQRLVRSVQPQIVHCHSSSAAFTTALAREKDWPLTLATFHGLSFPVIGGSKGTCLRIAESWAASRMDASWVLTIDDAIAMGRVCPRAKVEVLPGFGVGCDLDRFDPDRFTPVQRKAVRAHLGFSETDTVFLFVGRFVNFKGFHLVVRAVEQITRKRPDAKLLLVGANDPVHPSGLSEEEQSKLAENRNIVQVGYQNQVEPYLAASDALVFPSNREGMPVCVMEALSMGIPVITRNSRGCRDAVRHKIDGLVLEDGSLEALAEAMTGLCKDPQTRRRMSAQAVAGRSRFSRNRFVAEQIEIYRKALSQAAAASPVDQRPAMLRPSDVAGV